MVMAMYKKKKRKKTRSINILKLNFHGRRDKRLRQRLYFEREGPIHAKSAVCQLYLITEGKIKILFGTIKLTYFLNGVTTSTGVANAAAQCWVNEQWREIPHVQGQ